MAKRPFSPAKFLLKALAVLAATVAALFVLLLAACALPGDAVLRNVYASTFTIQQEGLYPEYGGFKLFQMDNYTDTIMLFEAAAMSEQPPLTAAMTATTYNVDNFETMADDLQAYCAGRLGLADAAQSAADLEPFSYARYWHGYLIWLRPLLCVTTVTGVRVAQYAVLFALLAGVLLLLKKQCGLRPTVWFALSQLLVSVVFVPRQVQFFTTFCIAYAGCLWVLAKRPDGQNLALGLICLGACTSFCDLLVTPILTLGLPVTVWLLRPAREEASPAVRSGVVVGASVCWGGGYALCWASKWILAGAVTGQNVAADAIQQAGVRTSGNTWHGISLTWPNIFRFLYETLNSRGLFWPMVIVFIAAIAWVCLCVTSKTALAQAAPLLLCALMAPAWLMLLRSHSIQHGWFTWRSLGVTLLALPACWHTACSARTGLARCHAIFTKP